MWLDGRNCRAQRLLEAWFVLGAATREHDSLQAWLHTHAHTTQKKVFYRWHPQRHKAMMANLLFIKSYFFFVCVCVCVSVCLCVCVSVCLCVCVELLDIWSNLLDQLWANACIQDHIELADYKMNGKRERFSLWHSPYKGLSRPSRKTRYDTLSLCSTLLR